MPKTWSVRIIDKTQTVEQTKNFIQQYLTMLPQFSLFMFLTINLTSLSKPVVANHDGSLENRLQKLEDVVVSLTSQLQSERKKTEILEQKLKFISTQVNTSSNVVDDILHRSVRQASSGVAFSARLSHPLSGLGIRETLIFDVLAANHGNGYNTGTGLFTAPVSGFYVFTWSTSNRAMDYQQTELVKQGQPQAYSFVDSKDHLTAVTTTITVLSVRTGESVWIRTGSNGNSNICCNEYDSFSGWLLFST